MSNNTKTSKTFFDVNIIYVRVTLQKYVAESNKPIEINLLECFRKIILYEDIFQKLITGSIAFTDKYKKFNLTPLNGSEKLVLSIKSKITNQEYTFNFLVTSVEFIQTHNSDDQEVVLTLRDEKYINFTKEYSTSFNNIPISTFVKNFSNNVLKKTIDSKNVELSKYDETDIKSFSFPYQKFHYMLTYLNQYIKNSDGNVFYNYFSNLFETYYVSLSSLFKKTPQVSYKEVLTSKVQDNVNYFFEFTINGTFNTEDIILGRGFGTTMYYFDYETKQHVSNIKKYSDIINSEYSLGKYSKFDSTMDNEKSFTYFAATNNHKNKLSIIGQNLDVGGNISIKFTGLIERTCGEIATLYFKDYLNEKEKYNLTTSGNYLIKSIYHELYPGKYEQTLNFIRNAEMVKDTPKQINIPTSKQKTQSYSKF